MNTLKAFNRLLCWMFLTFIATSLSAKNVSTLALIDSLESQLILGEKRALRDLGTLLNKDQYKEQVLASLSSHCLFTEEEIVLSDQLTKTAFLEFYYSNKDSIYFDPIIQSFLITPLKDRRSVHIIRSSTDRNAQELSTIINDYVYSIKAKISSGRNDIKKEVNALSSIGTTESFEALIHILDIYVLGWETKTVTKEQMELICNGLKNYSTMRSLNTVLSIYKLKLLDTPKAIDILSHITNLKPKKDINYTSLTQYYEQKIDSLGSIQKIRDFGYEQLYNYRPFYFFSKADYYGKILSQNNLYPWIQNNVVNDLLKTGEPIAFYYISAYLYRIRNSDRLDRDKVVSETTSAIRHYTHLDIGVEDEEGRIMYSSVDPFDPTALKNYLFYWAPYHVEYSWDRYTGLYSAKKTRTAESQSYTQLLEELSSKDTDNATAAFIELSEGNPEEVINSINKNRHLLFRTNRALPSMKYDYLHQLVQLTSYFKRNNISYELNAELKILFDKLLKDIPAKNRYQIENNIIDRLDIESISKFEYWMILNSSNIIANYSGGRILDRAYSKIWTTVTKKENELRHYLKKTALFENIGVGGIVMKYLNKMVISKDPFIRHQLQEILDNEFDEDIINQVYKVLNSADLTRNVNIGHFIRQPSSFSHESILRIAEPNEATYSQVIMSIGNAQNVQDIKQYFAYLKLYPSVKQVPALMQLIKYYQNRLHGSNQQLVIFENGLFLLEEIFSYSFEEETLEDNIKVWVDLWEDQGNKVSDWETLFFNKNISKLEKNDAINISNLNRIARTSKSRKDHKAFLKYLSKVLPVDNVAELQLDYKLSVHNDLKYFKELDLGFKGLNNIVDLFDINDPQVMLEFLHSKISELDPIEQGIFYDNLFQELWFSDYLATEDRQSVLPQKIERILKHYYNVQHKELSDMEKIELESHIFLISNTDKTSVEKLEALKQQDTQKELFNLNKISILSMVKFEEIADVLEFLKHNCSDSFEEDIEFVRRDFGLPIYNLTEEKDYLILLKDLYSLPKKDLYIKYLRLFGVDFLSYGNSEDFYKIYELLEYELVHPFANNHGFVRDYFVYGIIKILELKFNTRLGFHQKINNNQHYKAITSGKRAKAWQKFLEEEGYVREKMVLNSFNR